MSAKEIKFGTDARDLPGVGGDVDATQRLFARGAAEFDFFGCHCENS